MSPNVLSTRMPWQDRWAQPTLLQLLEPLKIQHRRLFEQLMAELAEFEQVDQAILWYGSAWNWTIQYQLRAEAISPEVLKATSHDPSDDPQTLVYLVPRVETPIICIPLSDQIIEQLPMKRLNRFIRDGIKNAKCAVAIHWATWTPNSKAEVGFLTDLLKRKCKLVMGGMSKAEKADLEDEEVKPKGRGRKGKNAKAAEPVTLEQDAGEAPVVEHPPKTKKRKVADKPAADKAAKAEKLVKKTTKSAKAADAKPAKTAKAGKSASKQKVATTAKPAKSGNAAKVAKASKPAKSAKAAKPAKSPRSPKSPKSSKPVKTAKAAAGKGKAKTAASKTSKQSTKKSTKKTTKKVTRPAAKSAAKPAAKSAAKSATKTARKSAAKSASRPAAKKTASKGATPKRAGQSKVAAGSKRKR